MERNGRFPAELRERAVRLVFETQDDYSSQMAAIKSVAVKEGYVHLTACDGRSDRPSEIMAYEMD